MEYDSAHNTVRANIYVKLLFFLISLWLLSNSSNQNQSEWSESVSKTFFGQLFVVNQFAVPQVVKDGTKVGWVSVNHIGSCLILLHRDKQKKKKKKKSVTPLS